MNLPLENTDCVGQDELCKICDYKEPDHIEADNGSHSGKIPCELFCVTGKDSDYIDIEDLY